MSDTLIAAPTPALVETEPASSPGLSGAWVNVIVRRQPSPLATTLREAADSAWQRLCATTPDARRAEQRVERVDGVVLHLTVIHVEGRRGGPARTLLQAVSFCAGEQLGHLDQLEVTAVIALGADPQRDVFARHVAALQRTAS